MSFNRNLISTVSIRALFGTDKLRNAIYASDSLISAEKDKALFMSGASGSETAEATDSVPPIAPVKPLSRPTSRGPAVCFSFYSQAYCLS